MGGMFSMCHPDPFQPVKLQPIPATARRRALIIGVTYRGMPEQLDSCTNDARAMHAFLKSRGFQGHEITMLVEDAPHADLQPTRANIIQALQWLVRGAAPGDSLFFYFAGHGMQVPDLDGDEDDGLDETVLPMDFKAAGHISDDDLFAMIVRPLPPGCRLTAVMDCCHSGTGLDLPFAFKGTRNRKNSITRKRSTVMVPCMWKLKKSNGDVLLFSGCCDDEQSMDTDNSSEISSAIGAAPTSATKPRRGRFNDTSSVMSDNSPPAQTKSTAAAAPKPPHHNRGGVLCCGGSAAENDDTFGGVAVYDDLDTYVHLKSFCMDCDDPYTAFCKNTGKSHQRLGGGPHQKGNKVRATGKAGGALTTAFTQILHNDPNIKLIDLVLRVRSALRRLGFDQIVQLSGSKPFKLESPFEI
eukprot:PhM_4_TR14060/c0_g1_i1/m.9976